MLGGAVRVWGRCLAAGWIRPAVRVGPIQYHRYGDKAAMAERLCGEQPLDLIAVGREETDQRLKWRELAEWWERLEAQGRSHGPHRPGPRRGQPRKGR